MKKQLPSKQIRKPLALARETVRVLRAELVLVAGGFTVPGTDPDTETDGNGPCTFNLSGCRTGPCPSANECPV